MSKEKEMSSFFSSSLNNTTEQVTSVTDVGSCTSRTSETITSRKYNNYYDVSDTIDTAGASDPNDFDSAVYNREEVFKILERNAEILSIINDGSNDLYVIVSHNGGLSYSKEVPVYSGEIKTYYNVYELRIRSTVEDHPYRVMEYDVDQTSAVSELPTTVIVGTKTGISNVASQITATSTIIYKAVTIRVRSFGTGTYFAIGDSATQEFRLTAIGDSHDIDWIDNLNKVYVITDAGNTGVLEYIGG